VRVGHPEDLLDGFGELAEPILGGTPLLVGVLPRLFALVDADGEADVAGELFEQAAFFGVEGTGPLRVDVEGPEGPVAEDDRERRHRLVAALECVRPPRRGLGVMGDVVAHRRLPGGEGPRGDGAASRRLRRDEPIDDLLRGGIGAGLGPPRQPTAVAIEQSEPGHAPAAGVDRDATGFLEELAEVRLADDRLVDVAQHGVDPVQVTDPLVVALAVGDVEIDPGQVGRQPVVTGQAAAARRHPAHGAVRQHDAELGAVDALADGALDLGDQGGAIVGMDQRHEGVRCPRRQLVGETAERATAAETLDLTRPQVAEPDAQAGDLEGGLELHGLPAPRVFGSGGLRRPDLPPGPAGRQIEGLAPQLELRHDLAGQGPQGVELFGRQGARHDVGDGKRTDREAVGRPQRHPGVGPQMGVPQHERMIREALVTPGVFDDEEVGRVDRVRAEREVPRRLAGGEADA
jgi:hypothetical protein